MKKLIFILLVLLFSFSIPIVAKSPFTDLSASHWASSYVNDLVHKGIMQGFPDNTFKPNQSVSRAEVSKIVFETIKYMENNQPQVNIEYKENGDFEQKVIDVVANSIPSIVQIKDNTGTLGSGFIIKNNQILTAQHVIEGMKEITVVLSNGVSYKANIIKQSKDVDLALLSINESSALKYLEFDTNVKLAQTVIKIGNSRGEVNSVTSGVVSNLNRDGLIQTDAAINQSDSGSPLIGLNGRVLGVTIVKISEVDIDNMAWAVKSSLINEFLNN